MRLQARTEGPQRVPRARRAEAGGAPRRARPGSRRAARLLAAQPARLGHGQEVAQRARRLGGPLRLGRQPRPEQREPRAHGPGHERLRPLLVQEQVAARLASRGRAPPPRRRAGGRPRRRGRAARRRSRPACAAPCRRSSRAASIAMSLVLGLPLRQAHAAVRRAPLAHRRQARRHVVRPELRAACGGLRAGPDRLEQGQHAARAGAFSVSAWTCARGTPASTSSAVRGRRTATRNGPAPWGRSAPWRYFSRTMRVTAGRQRASSHAW